MTKIPNILMYILIWWEFTYFYIKKNSLSTVEVKKGGDKIKKKTKNVGAISITKCYKNKKIYVTVKHLLFLWIHKNTIFSKVCLNFKSSNLILNAINHIKQYILYRGNYHMFGKFLVLFPSNSLYPFLDYSIVVETQFESCNNWSPKCLYANFKFSVNCSQMIVLLFFL